MSSHDHRSEQPDPATTQVPHVPGQNPHGSGLPRQRGAVLPTSPSEGAKKPPPPGEEDAPLGGSKVTEEQLTADTAVERDTLKSLDPNDSPA